MACYVDTSVWLALLGREVTAKRVADWFEKGVALTTSVWTAVEIASALGVKARRGELTQQAVSAVCKAYRDLLDIGIVQVQNCQITDFNEAQMLCEQVASGMRAGDALHLSVAVRSGCSQFFSFDKTLNQRASLAGLELIAI